jgi:hypothetical protein
VGGGDPEVVEDPPDAPDTLRSEQGAEVAEVPADELGRNGNTFETPGRLLEHLSIAIDPHEGLNPPNLPKHRQGVAREPGRGVYEDASGKRAKRSNHFTD